MDNPLYETTPLAGKIWDFFKQSTCHFLSLWGGRGGTKTYSAIEVHCIEFVNETRCNYLFGTAHDNMAKNTFLYTIRDTITKYNLPLTVTESPLRVKNQHGRVIFCLGFDKPENAKTISRVGRTLLDEINLFNHETFKTIVGSTREIDQWSVTWAFNPVSPDIWIKTQVIDIPQYYNNMWQIHTTCEHNPFLPESKKEYYRNLTGVEYEIDYLGNYGTVTSDLVFGNKLRVVEEIPEHAKFISYGLDFSNSEVDPDNDPHSLIALYYADGELYLHQIYEGVCPVMTVENNTVMLHEDNIDLYSIITYHCPEHGVQQVQGIGGIIADRANRGNIDRLQNVGINIEGYEGLYRTKDTLNTLNTFKRINITESSLSLKQQFYNYKWKLDKSTNRILEHTPDKRCIHHAIDAVCYGITVFSW